MSEYEMVERPGGARRPARAGIFDALLRTAETGKALRTTASVEGFYTPAIRSGYRIHQRRDGDGWIAWAERIETNGHAEAAPKARP